jgi:hypothetical protein
LAAFDSGFDFGLLTSSERTKPIDRLCGSGGVTNSRKVSNGVMLGSGLAIEHYSSHFIGQNSPYPA